GETVERGVGQDADIGHVAYPDAAEEDVRTDPEARDRPVEVGDEVALLLEEPAAAEDHHGNYREHDGAHDERTDDGGAGPAAHPASLLLSAASFSIPPLPPAASGASRCRKSRTAGTVQLSRSSRGLPTASCVRAAASRKTALSPIAKMLGSSCV